MEKLRVRLAFPGATLKRPHIHEVGDAYGIVWSVRAANVTKDFGWVHLEMSGEEENLKKAVDAFEARGITVGPVEGDVISS